TRCRPGPGAGHARMRVWPSSSEPEWRRWYRPEFSYAMFLPFPLVKVPIVKAMAFAAESSSVLPAVHLLSALARVEPGNMRVHRFGGSRRAPIVNRQFHR